MIPQGMRHIFPIWGEYLKKKEEKEKKEKGKGEKRGKREEEEEKGEVMRFFRLKLSCQT